MIPYSKDITIRFGDTFEIFFRIRERAWDSLLSAWVPGVYRDLTGYTVLSQVRETEDATPVLIDFTETLGDQADETNGRGLVTLYATDELTGALSRSLQKGVWDVQLTSPAGETFTYVAGNVTFDKDVSRA